MLLLCFHEWRKREQRAHSGNWLKGMASFARCPTLNQVVWLQTLNPLFCCLLSSCSTVDSKSAWMSTAIKVLANSSHVFLLEFKCLYLYNTLTFENIFIWFSNEVGIAINFMVEMRKPKFGESVISQGNLAAKLYVRLGLNTTTYRFRI